MDQLPLFEDSNGGIYFEDTPVSLLVDYSALLGNGGQGAVFRGRILSRSGEEVVREVRVIDWSLGAKRARTAF